MKLNKEMYNLMSDLECLIGTESYNPNAYDGWNNVYGCFFRYPVNITDKNGNCIKIRTNIYESSLIDNNNLTEESFLNMIYKFGSNQLYIGRGLTAVLKYLEERYNLDFNELEKSKQSSDSASKV